MCAVDFLASRAQRHAAEAERHPPAFQDFIPSFGDEHDEAPPDIEGLDPARETIFGSTFAIEYTDSKGRFSRRRVTALRFDGHYLTARCHERNALRLFKCSNISCVIDRQGVVYETADFFRQISFPVVEGPDPAKMFAPGVQVLTAIAHSDGWVAPEESEKIVAYCAHVCDRMGIDIDQALADKIAFFVRNAYPSSIAVSKAIQQLKAMPGRDRNLILRYAVEVMDADGVQHPAEFKLVAAIHAEANDD